MDNNYDQLKIEYSETDKESNSVKLMCFFLILIFAVVPLAEIVTDFTYNTISYHSTTYICPSGLDFPFEPLSFKVLK
mgnify:CR=1 FL=1